MASTSLALSLLVGLAIAYPPIPNLSPNWRAVASIVVRRPDVAKGGEKFEFSGGLRRS